MNAPSVVSTLRSDELNFTFHVKAYKKLTHSELKRILNIWMRHKRITKLPKNKTITYITILGFDE